MHPRHHDPYLRPGLSGGDGERHLLTWLGFVTAPVERRLRKSTQTITHLPERIMCLFEKMEEYIKNKKKKPKKRALLSWPMCTCAVSLMTSPSERMQYTVTQASGDQDTVGIREKEEDVCVPPANT